MFNLFISLLSMICSTVFMNMKHPLAMGLMLLIQTFLICLISGLLTKTFWFSYVLFLIFLGGMLVLFIYVTALASNEMFSFSMKLLLFCCTSFLLIYCLMFLMDKSLLINTIKNTENMLMTNMTSLLKENTFVLNKLYNFPINMNTIMLMIYLFLTLIAIVKITNVFEGPCALNFN